MKVIGMVVAMQKEIMPFIEAQKVDVVSEVKFGFDVNIFTLSDKKIVCVKSGIGEICSASATQLLIGVYGAEVIVNFGVCGSLSDNLKVKGIALVKGVVHYDFDLTAIDDLSIGQYPGFDSAIIPTDENLRAKVKEFCPDIKEVICASADKFVSNEDYKYDLNKIYGAEICEMESAGILYTSKNAGVPALLIKAVSDGKGGADEYNKMVFEASRSYIDLVCKLAEVL